MSPSRRAPVDDAGALGLPLFEGEAAPRAGNPPPREPASRRTPPRARRAAPVEPPAPAPAPRVEPAPESFPVPEGIWSPGEALGGVAGSDDIPGSSAASAVAVGSLTRTVKDVLEGAFLPLWVRGEVSDFKAHRNGHWYFCLRDGDAQIRCVVWARDQRRIPAPPDDGMQVAALGQVTVWPTRGDLQLVVKAMEAQGDGLWRKALELAVARLTAEGLLAAERKRPLPRVPRVVAVVTSPDGAALHDVIAVARRRAPHVRIVVVPTKVQGDGAPEEIVAALDRLARWGGADVAIVGRGGGAREDLWAFNDERVARALAALPMPAISAVGHEVDVSLCDLVADLRAPTPSAAAEAAFPESAALRELLERRGAELHDSLVSRLERHRERLDHDGRRLARALARLAERRRARLEGAAARLHALSPLATLARGYAVARDGDGRPLRALGDFAVGAPFALQLRDGVVDARVEQLRPRDPSAS